MLSVSCKAFPEILRPDLRLHYYLLYTGRRWSLGDIQACRKCNVQNLGEFCCRLVPMPTPLPSSFSPSLYTLLSFPPPFSFPLPPPPIACYSPSSFPSSLSPLPFPSFLPFSLPPPPRPSLYLLLPCHLLFLLLPFPSSFPSLLPPLPFSIPTSSNRSNHDRCRCTLRKCSGRWSI